MRKLDKVSGRLSFSPKYRRAVAENAIKPLIFMYQEAVSIFLGSANVLISVYFWAEYIFGFFKNILCLTPPPRHIPIKVPPGFLFSITYHYILCTE